MYDTLMGKNIFAADILHLKLYSNGGIGVTRDIITSESKEVTIPDNPFERDGYTFAGWCTYEGGSEIEYASNDTVFLFENDISLYAVWKIDAPDVKALKCKNDGIKVTWNERDGADSYNIYKKISDTNEWALIANTNDTSYKDTDVISGEKYLYCVTSIDGTYESSYSEMLETAYIIAPGISNLVSESKDCIKFEYSDDNGSLGYEFECSITEDFSDENTVTITELKNDDEENVITIKDLDNNTTYYIRSRSYYKSGSNTWYSAWSETLNVTTPKIYAFEDIDADMVVTSDVALSGTGTGYHAKIVIGTVQSAVSFGIQYDEGACYPYAGKTMALLENIQSNYNGEQQYPRFAELEAGKSYNLILALNMDGYGSAYVDGVLVGEFYNPYVVNSGDMEIWVEGAARFNGDSVDAVFQNMKARVNGSTYEGINGTIVDDKDRGTGISYYATLEEPLIESEDVADTEDTESYSDKIITIHIEGTIHGIDRDWDASFYNASSIAHITPVINKDTQ